MSSQDEYILQMKPHGRQKSQLVGQGLTNCKPVEIETSTGGSMANCCSNGAPPSIASQVVEAGSHRLWAKGSSL